MAEISPAVRHDSLKHLCCRKFIHERAVEDRGGPISVSSVRAPPESLLDARSSVLKVHLEKLDVLQHGALKFISGSLPEDRGVEESRSRGVEESRSRGGGFDEMRKGP